MLQDQAQKFNGRQGAGFKLFGFTILVTKRHQAMLPRQNILLLNHPPVPVNAKPSFKRIDAETGERLNFTLDLMDTVADHTHSFLPDS